MINFPRKRCTTWQIAQSDGFTSFVRALACEQYMAMPAVKLVTAGSLTGAYWSRHRFRVSRNSWVDALASRLRYSKAQCFPSRIRGRATVAACGLRAVQEIALTLLQPKNSRQTRPASSAAPNPLMWITPGRVCYAGLLGRPSVRKIGGISIYIAQQAPIRVSIDGEDWLESDLLIVPPYVPHCVTSEARFITDLIVEPETVDHALLPAFMRDRRGIVHAPEFVEHVRHTLEHLRARRDPLPLDDAAFDQAFFGEPLPRATLDRRVTLVLADIATNPGDITSAADYAARANVSFSRFVHLFKDEVGAPLRSFRSWKRARSILAYVTQNANLADIAQQTGYPDSSHFSHSIRQVFGLTPKDVFAGSRRLQLHGESDAIAVRRRV